MSKKITNKKLELIALKPTIKQWYEFFHEINTVISESIYFYIDETFEEYENEEERAHFDRNILNDIKEIKYQLNEYIFCINKITKLLKKQHRLEQSIQKENKNDNKKQ